MQQGLESQNFGNMQQGPGSQNAGDIQQGSASQNASDTQQGNGSQHGHDTQQVDDTQQGSGPIDRPIGHLDAFFAQYPDFDYRREAPSWVEFNRMCDKFQWGPEHYLFRAARRNFKTAMVKQFNDLYGTDENDLEAWQKLCRIMRIRPVSQDLEDCRVVSRWRHVPMFLG
jgi:hypothetical protein